MSYEYRIRPNVSDNLQEFRDDYGYEDVTDFDWMQSGALVDTPHKMYQANEVAIWLDLDLDDLVTYTKEV